MARRTAEDEVSTPSRAGARVAAAKKAAAKKTATAKVVKKAAPKASAKAAPAKKTAKTAAAPKAKAPAKTPAKKAATKAAPSKKTAKAPAGKATAVKKAVTKAPAKAPAPAKTPPTKAIPPKKAAPVKAPPAKKPVVRKVGPPDKFTLAQRDLLLEQREEHVNQANEFKAEADSLAQEMEPGDADFGEEGGEGGTLSIDRERDLALSAQARAVIEDIDDALAKIEQGTYGLCENCGKPIIKDRLRFIPWARLCVACKTGGLSRR